MVTMALIGHPPRQLQCVPKLCVKHYQWVDTYTILTHIVRGRLQISFPSLITVIDRQACMSYINVYKRICTYFDIRRHCIEYIKVLQINMPVFYKWYQWIVYTVVRSIPELSLLNWDISKTCSVGRFHGKFTTGTRGALWKRVSLIIPQFHIYAYDNCISYSTQI